MPRFAQELQPAPRAAGVLGGPLQIGGHPAGQDLADAVRERDRHAPGHGALQPGRGRVSCDAALTLVDGRAGRRYR
ncbi:hypothetical protein [Micromonospora sp. CPCC 206061]|uniref:hypothetical protein n=1 Tax=Micromonospora sp. CPCC 206061 TaxID=3122410 RepID=UPI002FF3A75C